MKTTEKPKYVTIPIVLAITSIVIATLNIYIVLSR